MSSSSKKNDGDSKNMLYVAVGAVAIAAVGYFMFASGGETKKRVNNL